MSPVTAILGDSREKLAEMEACSIDACVCDPPYALVSIVKRSGADGAAPAKSIGATGAYARASAGFMGQKWDTGETAFDPAFWAEVLRVLKPGAHLLALGGTRTYHRLACAIEDAGFEVRDAVMWHYGSGFPKSLDVSKAIDKAAGAAREVVGAKRNNKGDSGQQQYAAFGVFKQSRFTDITAPATDAAKQWEGWGTALKPSTEIIVLARKPLSEATVAANVLRWGTGALNVDGCRVSTQPGEDLNGGTYRGCGSARHDGWGMQRLGGAGEYKQPTGRWPANLIHDGSEEVLAGFPESVSSLGSTAGSGISDIYGEFERKTRGESIGRGDSGSAARFFYTAKADVNDRCGSKHPTCKPVDLMQYLVRLVTPKGGLVLDPFAGSGTTGEAAIREGMRAILIEREPQYFEDIQRRISLALAGPEERARAIIKAKGLVEAVESLPLFNEAAE